MKTKLLILLGGMVILFFILIRDFSGREYAAGGYMEITYDPLTMMYNATLHGDNDERQIISWFDSEKEQYWFFLPEYTSGYEVIDRCDESAPHPLSEINFMYSENVPTLYIDIVDETEYIFNRENWSSGTIKIINSKGDTEYDGELEKINGRGNSTWGTEKHPFNLHLKKKSVLLEMGASRKWCLLAMYKEGTHLNTKVTLDIAKAFGLRYTPDATWVDVYINGNYFGNYLLTEPIGVSDCSVPGYDLEKWNAENNEDLDSAPLFEEENYKGYLLENGDMTDGTYVVEKDTFFFYRDGKAGFSTEDGGTFTIKKPEHASKEQVEYIKPYFEHITETMMDDSMDIDLDAFDLESLADRGWVEEISSNQDAFYGSMFFYKLQGDDKLYSGPVWDYDRSFGENNSRSSEGRNVDPAKSMFEYAYWYRQLTEDPRFIPIMRNELEKATKALDRIYYEKIDEYSEFIRKSVEMDHIRFRTDRKIEDRPGNYASYDNNIRFMKWFMCNRLNNLYDKWEIDHKHLTFNGDGTPRKVTVKKDDQVILSTEVLDGDILHDRLPELSEEYEGWNVEFCDEPYWQFMPVFEDLVIYAKRSEE